MEELGGGGGKIDYFHPKAVVTFVKEMTALQRA